MHHPQQAAIQNNCFILALSFRTVRALMPLPPISPQQMWVTTQIRFKYLISTLLITICLLPPSSPASCVVSFQTTQELMTMHAREAIQACVSEFISFITDEAKERCQMESRRILTANDLCSHQWMR